MTHNKNLQIEQDTERVVAKITPVGTDTVAKVIKQSKISIIYIQDSILFGMKTTKDHTRYTIIRSNLTPILGQGVNLSFKLNQGNLKQLDKIKGNQDMLILDRCVNTYLVTNGNYTSVIGKAKPQKLDDFLPSLTGGKSIKQQTNKCRQIARAKGKSKFGDIFIYGNQIVMVHLPAINAFMSVGSISTTEFIERKPDVRLRSHFLFHVIADEALLEISLYKGVFWLRTEIKLTEDIVIEQFEPLQRIK